MLEEAAAAVGRFDVSGGLADVVQQSGPPPHGGRGYRVYHLERMHKGIVLVSWGLAYTPQGVNVRYLVAEETIVRPAPKDIRGAFRKQSVRHRQAGVGLRRGGRGAAKQPLPQHASVVSGQW